MYEVSDTGEVRNKLTGKLVFGDRNSCGYRRVSFYNKEHNPPKQRVFLHRLVAQTFLENPDNLPEVNHIDHNLENNNLSNLEWCSRKYKELDSRKNGSKVYRPFKVWFINGEIKTYDVKPDLANELNVTRALVKQWLHHRTSSYVNYGIKKIEYI